jgi:hypothetical protein
MSTEPQDSVQAVTAADLKDYMFSSVSDEDGSIVGVVIRFDLPIRKSVWETTDAFGILIHQFIQNVAKEDARQEAMLG